MAKTILPAATAAFVLLSGGAALAAEPVPAESAAAKPQAAAAKPETPAWETEAATRRAGFSLGVLIGGAAGQITGYPNDVNKRGKTQFYADTGAALGGNLTLWLGGALTDWLVFGAGLSGTMATGNGILVQGLTFAFHTEVFPLFSLGGIWQELGVGFDTGVGNFTGELQNKPAGDAGKLIGPVLDSGAASRFAAAVFYDGFRLSKISAGPFVAFDYSWSPTMERPLVVIGLRSALYVKAPKKK